MVSGTAPSASKRVPRCTSSVASPPSSRSMFGPTTSPFSSRNSNRRWVHHQYSGRRLALPGEDRHAGGLLGGAVTDDDRRGGVVLGGEDVAADPADVGAQRGQRLDEDGGLHGHVQRAGDAGAGERLGVAVLGAQRHEAGHLVLGEVDLLAAEAGEGEVGDLEVAVGQGGRCGCQCWRSCRSRVRPGPRRGRCRADLGGGESEHAEASAGLVRRPGYLDRTDAAPAGARHPVRPGWWWPGRGRRDRGRSPARRPARTPTALVQGDLAVGRAEDCVPSCRARPAGRWW